MLSAPIDTTAAIPSHTADLAPSLATTGASRSHASPFLIIDSDGARVVMRVLSPEDVDALSAEDWSPFDDDDLETLATTKPAALCAHQAARIAHAFDGADELAF